MDGGGAPARKAPDKSMGRTKKRNITNRSVLGGREKLVVRPSRENSVCIYGESIFEEDNRPLGKVFLPLFRDCGIIIKKHKKAERERYEEQMEGRRNFASSFSSRRNRRQSFVSLRRFPVYHFLLMIP